jgi:hypothetical protein
MPSEPPDADPHVRWCGGRRGELGAYPMCAQHDQQLGGASPLWRLMTPTTSRGQLRRREAGWEGSRRRNRDPRNTWRVGSRSGSGGLRVGGGAVWASQLGMAKPVVIKGPSRGRGGCARKVAGLTWGGLRGCPRCPVRVVRGVVRDGGVREGAARCGEVSRGRITSGIAVRWEGPNAKPSARTFVLVVVAVIAANPFGGLAGRVQR